MNYLEQYIFWKTDEFFNEATRRELSVLDPELNGKEIEDRFYHDLEFGTGGLRSVMGAGTNRMNKYTVGKATKGFDDYLMTDPDSDRAGIAVKVADGEYQLMTGNQVGALLMDFVLDNTDLSALHHPAAVKTVVTSELGVEIARKKGLTVFSTLTGFRFSGEKITQFEQAKINWNPDQDNDFIFNYEESYGYLAGTHARDKDAVVSALLICEMAAKAKAEGMTLVDKINQIYAEFGYYLDALDSSSLEGKEGLKKIGSMMSELRSGDSPLDYTAQVIDYSKPVKAEPGFGTLPISNVLKYILTDSSWIAVVRLAPSPI